MRSFTDVTAFENWRLALVVLGTGLVSYAGGLVGGLCTRGAYGYAKGRAGAAGEVAMLRSEVARLNDDVAHADGYGEECVLRLLAEPETYEAARVEAMAAGLLPYSPV